MRFYIQIARYMGWDEINELLDRRKTIRSNDKYYTEN